MMIQFRKRVVAAAVAALIFAQSIVLPAGATMATRAPERAPARATQWVAADRAQATLLAPDRAPARADEWMQAPASQPAPNALLLAQPAQGGMPQEAQPGPVAERGRLVVIDPGHGGRDPGAVYTNAAGEVELTEEEATLAVSHRLAEMLRADGYEVQMTRTADADVAPGSKAADLQARIDLANRTNADLLISVHFNGIAKPEIRGTEVWYSGSRAFADGNARLARSVQEALVRNLQQAGYDTVDRGIKDDRNMGGFALLSDHVARPSNMPGIIGEALFMTNEQDATQLQRPEIQEAVARGYFEGIKAYFGDS